MPVSINKSQKNNITGFSLSKIINPSSLFYGTEILKAAKSLSDPIYDFICSLPSSNDNVFVAGLKTAACIYKLANHFLMPIRWHSHFKNIKYVEFDTHNARMQIVKTIKSFACIVESINSYDCYIEKYKIGNGFVFLEYSPNNNEDCLGLWILDITKKELANIVWMHQGNSIFISSDDENINIEKTSLSNNNLYGSSLSLVDKLSDDYNYFRDKNISRTYLLIGNPGTGKSAIISAFTKRIKGRCVVLSGFCHPIILITAKSIFSFLEPDFIILDDCDRSENTPNAIRSALDFIDYLKFNNPNITFLFAANKFDGILSDPAFTRKGRIDQIIEIPEPNAEDRKVIIKKYFEVLDTSKSEDEINSIVLDSDGMTGADLKEMCIQLKRCSIDEFKKRELEILRLKDKYKSEEKQLYLMQGNLP
jgi:DNA replication protein DnaC